MIPKTKSRQPVELAHIALDYHWIGGHPADCRGGAGITKLQPRKKIHVPDFKREGRRHYQGGGSRSPDRNDGHDVGRTAGSDIDRRNRSCSRMCSILRWQIATALFWPAAVAD